MGFGSAVVYRRSWVLAVLTALAVWLAWATDATAFLERPISDLMLRLIRPTDAKPGRFAAVVIDDHSVEGLGPLPWPRSRLASLITAVHAGGASAVVVDILLSEHESGSGDDDLESALSAGPSILAAVVAPQVGWVLPLERFGGAAAAAHAHAEVGPDGVVREVASTKQRAGISLPALSVAAARMAGWTQPIPVGEILRPDFQTPPNTIQAVSAIDLLKGAGGSHELAGMVVFIGYSASGSGDQFLIPVGSRERPSAGVLVHASIASSIAGGGLLARPPGWVVLLIMLASALAAQWARSRAGRLPVPSVTAIFALLVGAGVCALWWTGSQLPVMSFLLAVVVSVAARETAESLEAQREAGALLATLFDSGPQAEEPVDPPTGASGRLRLARRLQRQLARDSELRRALLDGLSEGVVLWDETGQILLANLAAAQLWGIRPIRDEVMTALGHGSGGDEVRGEVEVVGRRLEVEVRTIRAGTLGILRDVTASRELERSRREVQRMVSHELKTPLSSISGFGAMIERYELSRDEQLRVAGLIRGEADRLGDMVRSFLDLERLGAGHWEDERREVDLCELAVRRCEFLRSAAEKAEHDLGVDVDGCCPVVGSEELLTRLVDNLVGNAVKHTPAGCAVRVTVRAANGTVELTVSDNGPGIDPEVIPRLFDRFYRGPEGGAAGSGLGLALVREIAHWHGATAEVSSGPGDGSVFTVRFPPTGAARSDDEG